MAEFLYDLPIGFYQQAVMTDGKFDPAKAAGLGYSPAQFPAIQKFLELFPTQDDLEASGLKPGQTFSIGPSK